MEIFKTSPYSLNKEDKGKLLNQNLNDLTKFHYENCNSYKRIIDSLKFDVYKDNKYEDLPFLPTRIFKTNDLKSISEEQIVKTMTSSGTSNQQLSKIFLDKETSKNQTKVLAKIMSEFIGNQRVPMIILDSENVVKNRNSFSARGAGILGFSMFGSKIIYALDDNMNLKIEAIKEFIELNKNKRILLFGFTYIVYEYFYKKIIKQNINLDLENSVLIHGGGWKKLVNKNINSKEFKQSLFETCKIKSIYNYYGMIEQTGSISIECEYGHFHSSIYSDIIIRRANDFSIANINEPGIIQTLSILPKSYPGHSLLTEDEGVLLGEDDCKCGRLGKYFKINGRLKNAEIRGCSDTYEK